MGSKLVLFAAVLFASALLLSSLELAPSGIFHDPRVKAADDSSGSSLNWGGYAVTGAPGSATDAKASWVVPSVTCPSTASQYSSFWVGIDGYSSNSVEQTGTDSDCSAGSPRYYAWYEFYPKPSRLISTLNVKPGDVISAEVNYQGANRYLATITDKTTGQSFSTTAKVSAQRSSAEWIFEAPSSGGILPLADFGSVNFGQDYTLVPSTSDATLASLTGPIGAFGTSIQQITMVNSAGGVKASPSALTTDGTSFTGTWHSN